MTDDKKQQKDFSFKEWKEMYQKMKEFCRDNDNFSKFCENEGLKNIKESMPEQCRTMFEKVMRGQ